MKLKFFISAIFWLALPPLVYSQSASQDNVLPAPTYTLGPEDTVEITIYNHPEFSGTFPVSSEGKIQYKSIGDVPVTGMTKKQLEEKVRELVAVYVVSPQVSVTITEFKSKSFYVLGEVAKPGKYYMRSEEISVKEAILMAGLPTPTALVRKARIMPAGINGGGKPLEVDLYALLYKSETSQNVLLKPGDTLYVPAAVTESVQKIKSSRPSTGFLKYRLGPDDVVQINVLDHPEFSGTYPVGPEGKIQYRSVGDIDVEGMTKRELEEKIQRIITPAVDPAEVDVTITRFRSKTFYVLGEVARPGKYYMRTESLTVKEAALMARLPTKAAAMRKAMIIRPGRHGSDITDIDLYAILYEAEPKVDAILFPGDTLFVPAAVTEAVQQRDENNKAFSPLKYTLGPDDVVQIEVSKHTRFSGTYPVTLEGKIQYKFVGDIDVAGMTKTDLEKKIRGLLSSYMPSPEVNVTITAFKSKVIYILGEVGAPGKYYMRSDFITVKEAIYMAGLPTTAAAMRKTKIVTPGVLGSTSRKVNLFELLYNGDLTENFRMRPGDYLYVPSTVLAKVIRIISPVSTTVGLAVSPTADVGNAKTGIETATR